MPLATPYSSATPTADDLIDQVRRRTQDLDSESYTDAILLDYLNAGMANLAVLAGCWMKTSAHTLTNGAVTLSSDVVGVLRVAGLSWSPPGEMSHWISESTATAYSIAGRKLYTNAPASGASLNLEVYYVPADLQAGLAAPVHATALDALVLYAVYRVRDADGDGSAAGVAYNEYVNLAKALQGAAVMEGK